ncbi:MAG: formylglycine-generating enzyme family protein [Pseudomonadota bacterium]
MIEMKTALRVRGPALSNLAVLSATMLLLILPEMAASETYTLSDGRTVETLETFQECNVCPEMIVLPLGSFTMGAPLEESAIIHFGRSEPGEPRGRQNEGPMHDVEIDRPFALGRNEVTRGEWMNCVSDGGCSHTPTDVVDATSGSRPATARDPVADISYLDIQEYLFWLNAKVGSEVYRLPTEAEWEYAARAGTQTLFAQGDRLSSRQAAFSERTTALSEGRPRDQFPRKTGPVSVDELDAENAWGLRHMAGNILEQTMSCWSERHLGLTTSSAYLEAARNVPNCKRTSKGGAYLANMYLARPASRGRSRETHRSEFSGFRILRNLE